MLRWSVFVWVCLGAGLYTGPLAVYGLASAVIGFPLVASVMARASI